MGPDLVLQGWLITLLTVELWLYAWLALRLAERGWAGWAIALLLLAIAFAWRASHALASFLAASVFRFRDGRREVAGSALAALWSEFCARSVSFNWSQPFANVVMGRDPAGPMAGTPILLVHGYASNRGMWVRFRQRLLAAHMGPIYSLNLEPLFAGIDEFATQLHKRIEDVCQESGAPQVVVIAHSMGGIVTRAYMVTHGADRVAALITLGSPHQGTRMAALGIGRSADQMRAGGAWLSMLKDKESAAEYAKPPTLSIYTKNDDLSYPPESAELAWAKNVSVAGVGHVGLLFSAEVFALVQEYLTNRDGLFQVKSAVNARQ